MAYFVKVNSEGTGDGSTWENASDNLQAVMDLAAADFVAGGEVQPVDVHVAKGTYTPAATLELPPGVRLLGGYPDNLSGRSVEGRDVKANVTALDGGKPLRHQERQHRRGPRGHGAGRLQGDERQGRPGRRDVSF